MQSAKMVYDLISDNKRDTKCPFHSIRGVFSGLAGAETGNILHHEGTGNVLLPSHRAAVQAEGGYAIQDVATTHDAKAVVGKPLSHCTSGSNKQANQLLTWNSSSMPQSSQR